MASPKVDDAHKAAQSLESYFLRRVLSEVKSSENSMTGGGFAGDTFKDMFDEAIADAMTHAGGVGLTDVIAKQLGSQGKKGAAAAPDAKTDSSRVPSETIDRPVPLPRAAGMSLHPVSKLVTDPLGNRTLEAQPPKTTEPSVTSPGTTGSVSLRRYREIEAADPRPSSLVPSGRPTDRR